MTTAPLYTAEAGFNLAAIMADAWATTRNAGRKATVEGVCSGWGQDDTLS